MVHRKSRAEPAIIAEDAGCAGMADLLSRRGSGIRMKNSASYFPAAPALFSSAMFIRDFSFAMALISTS